MTWEDKEEDKREDKKTAKYTFGYKVVMSRKFKDIIDWMSSNYDKEIGGFIIGKIEDDMLLLEDLIFPEQEADKGGIDFSTTQISGLMREHPEECNRIMGEWHSHNTMGCFWSGVDEGLINSFSEHRKLTVYIVSSKGKHLVRVEYREPFITFSLNDIGFCVINHDIENEMKEIIESKVKEPVYSSSAKGQKDIFGQKVDAKPNFINYGRNAIMMNNTVKIFSLHKALRKALQKDFAEYEPENVGKGCLLFKFLNKDNTEMFFTIVRDYIYSWDCKQDGVDEEDWRDDEELQSSGDYINIEELQE